MNLCLLHWQVDSLSLSHKDESHRSQKSLPSGRSSWTIGTGWSPSLLLQCLCPPAPPPEHQAPTGLMAAAAKSLQSCPTLCDPIDGSPPGSCPWDSPGKNTGLGCHFLLQCMKVKSESEVAQSCLTVSDPMDCRLPGSSTHGIFQARVLEWGAIASSKKLMKRC